MKPYKFIPIIFALLAFQFTANAQVTAAKEVTAKAEVLAPLKITSATVMDFGRLYSLAEGYSVTLVPSGATDSRTSDKQADVPTVTDETVKLAVLEIEGAANNKYVIAPPATSVDLSGSNGSSMTLGDFKAYTTSGNQITAATTIDGTGKSSFKLGATLTLGNTQAAGTYEGTFEVKVTYE